MDDQRGSRFVEVDFTGSHFRSPDLTDVRMTDGFFVNVELSGYVAGLTVNGVDVTDYVEQQLDERHPERLLLRPTTADGVRTAWTLVSARAAVTRDRARRLPESALHQSVDGEWSYAQTLRHLVMATDRWLSLPVWADPVPFHRLGIPSDPYDDFPPEHLALLDLDAQPSFADVLEARQGQLDRVSAYVASLDDAELDRVVTSPNGGDTTVRHCIHVVLKEEWWHDQYATRDLTMIEQA